MAERPQKPIILSEDRDTLYDLRELKRSYPVWRECDIYADQLRELFEIQNAKLVGKPEFSEQCEAFVAERTAHQDETLRGSWVYFPWNGLLVHMLPESEYIDLRTNRNRNLVTDEEQKALLDFPIGIIGLSVGSNVATTLAFSGIANMMKLAEFDCLETSNLNRMRARVDQIGMTKMQIVSQQVYEINPYAKLETFTEGINADTLNDFVTQKPRPRIIFEIIDSFEMKIHLRSLCREHGIPVVMVTNLGDRVLMDVERHDGDTLIEFFNGRAGDVPDTILDRPDITDEEKHEYAVALAGEQNIPKRALDSVAQIGNTLVGRPQLASTVTIAAGVSSYLARKIALGQDLPSRSWLVDLEDVFSETRSLSEASQKRKRSRRKNAAAQIPKQQDKRPESLKTGKKSAEKKEKKPSMMDKAASFFRRN